MGQAVDLLCAQLADLPGAALNGSAAPQRSARGRPRALLSEDPALSRGIRQDRLYLGHPSVVVRAIVIQARRALPHNRFPPNQPRSLAAPARSPARRSSDPTPPHPHPRSTR